jgi:hypothetical protein
VNNQSGITEVKLDIQIPDMAIREYIITDIQLSKVSDGWKAESLSKALAVKIRGRGPVLDRLTADQLTAHVDLSNAQLGNATYEATIEIEGFGEADNVGAVEKYTVPVRVEELLPVAAPEA